MIELIIEYLKEYLSTCYFARIHKGGSWFHYAIPVRDLHTGQFTGEKYSYWSQVYDFNYSHLIDKREHWS